LSKNERAQTPNPTILFYVFLHSHFIVIALFSNSAPICLSQRDFPNNSTNYAKLSKIITLGDATTNQNKKQKLNVKREKIQQF